MGCTTDNGFIWLYVFLVYPNARVFIFRHTKNTSATVKVGLCSQYHGMVINPWRLIYTPSLWDFCYGMDALSHIPWSDHGMGLSQQRRCQANLNEDAIDGDSKTASLLVLSMWKCWQRRCGYNGDVHGDWDLMISWGYSVLDTSWWYGCVWLFREETPNLTRSFCKNLQRAYHKGF